MTATPARGQITCMAQSKSASEISIRSAVRDAIESEGIRAVARRFQLHPQTICAIALGVSVRRGTLAAVDLCLREESEGLEP